jgi:putative ATP-binding cassette transporter
MSSLKSVTRFLVRGARGLRFTRLSFAMIVVLGTIGGLANTLLIAVINERLHAEGSNPRRLLWIFVALCLVMPLSRFASDVLLIRMAQRSILNLRLEISGRILRAPMRKLEELGAHRLLATLTEDVGRITGALVNIPILAMHGTVVLGCLGYLAYLSWRGLLVVLGFLILGVLTYQLPLIRAEREFVSARNWRDEVFRSLTALIRGTKELKLHRERRRDFLERRLRRSSLALHRHNVLGDSIAAAATSWGQILFFLLIGVVLFGVSVTFQLTEAVLIGYALTILYMIGPLEALLGMLPNFSRAGVAIEQIERLGLPLVGSHDQEPDSDAPPPSAWRSLELVGVKHTYYRENEDDRFVMGPLDLELEPGGITFIVGGNGSGKTTLAKLILGLYRPEEGVVRLDGRPIGIHNLDEYRQLFSAVFTDFFLFDALLGLGSEGLDDRARKYLRDLHLDRKVTVDGGTLSTVDLSQGQRKRLALLTAYLEDRPIFLFDEWAADQDPYFKEIFYRRLLPELRRRGKTVLVISHDERYYDLADRLVKLEDGQIVSDEDRGRFAELRAEEAVP